MTLEELPIFIYDKKEICILSITNFATLFIKIQPFFDYLHKRRTDRQNIVDKIYNEAIAKFGDLELKKDQLLEYMHTINNMDFSKDDNITKYITHTYNYFNGINNICDAINMGVIANISNFVVTVRKTLYYKHDKNDNLIIDCFNAINKIHIQSKQISLDTPKMIDYEPIFKVYRNNLPLWRKILGIIFNPFRKLK